MSLSVREATDADFERLAEVTVEAYANLPSAVYEEGYLDELADVGRRAREAVVLVAVDGGAVVGGVTYIDRAGPWATFDDEGEAELRMLAVATAAQGRGVAGLLVDACTERARAAGKRRIRLHTTTWMEAAQRVYSRAGFRRAPEIDIDVPPYFVLLGYVLDLHG